MRHGTAFVKVMVLHAGRRSALQVAAYVCRDRVACPNTGQEFDHRFETDDGGDGEALAELEPSLEAFDGEAAPALGEGRGDGARLVAYVTRSGKHRVRSDELLHSEVVLPDGTDERLRNPATLMAAAERCELTPSNPKKKDSPLRWKAYGAYGRSVLARHVIVAFPPGLDDLDDQAEACRRFAGRAFADHGSGVLVAIHKGDKDGKNKHAHLVATEREALGFDLESGRLTGKKIRALKPKCYRTGVVEQGWRGLWRDCVNEVAEERDLPVRVHATKAEAVEAQAADDARGATAREPALTFRAAGSTAVVLDFAVGRPGRNPFRHPTRSLPSPPSVARRSATDAALPSPRPERRGEGVFVPGEVDADDRRWLQEQGLEGRNLEQALKALARRRGRLVFVDPAGGGGGGGEEAPDDAPAAATLLTTEQVLEASMELSTLLNAAYARGARARGEARREEDRLVQRLHGRERGRGLER